MFLNAKVLFCSFKRYLKYCFISLYVNDSNKNRCWTYKTGNQIFQNEKIVELHS